jgi:hypothetical protein
MLKDYRTKDEPMRFPSKIRCERDCVLPGLGEWRAGELIADVSLIKKLFKHPFFKVTEE